MSNSRNLRDPNADSPKLVGKHVATAPRFDDWRRPVGVVMPDYGDDDETEHESSGGMGADVMLGVVDYLCAGGAIAAGRRTTLLAYLYKTPNAPQTLRELGHRLGVSHVAALRAVTRLRSDLLEIHKKLTK